MYPSIENDRNIAAVRNASKKRSNKTPSADYIIENLEICLNSNNSRFFLLQLNETTTGATNPCLYAE